MAVYGWRIYTVHWEVDDIWLCGGRGKAWLGPSLTAECQGSIETCRQHLWDWRIADRVHSGPVCGIYMKKQLDDQAYPLIVAACSGSGVVAEHEFGYRAEKVRIEHIWLIRDSLAWMRETIGALERRYGVECSVIDWEELECLKLENIFGHSSPPPWKPLWRRCLGL